MDSIRFHLDENVSPKVAYGMRLQGLEVTTSQEVGLLKARDETQFEFAQREQRIIITQDSDFLRISAHHFDHCGILFFTTRNTTIGELILEAVAIKNAGDGMRGIVKYA